MNILLACESSGLVRDAFIERGHDAISCDILPSERPGPHLQCDVRDVLGDGWDMMIAFPPCTDLAVSGARWFADKEMEQAAALDFVAELFDARILRKAMRTRSGLYPLDSTSQRRLSNRGSMGMVRQRQPAYGWNFCRCCNPAIS